MAAPLISPTKRTLSGPKASTPADWSDLDPLAPARALLGAAEAPPDKASPTAAAPARRKTSRLAWVPDTSSPDAKVVFICSIRNEVSIHTYGGRAEPSASTGIRALATLPDRAFAH